MSDLLPHSFDRLSAIAHNVWHVQRRFSILGIPASSRMTVVRLNDRGLWLHSPVRMDAALRAQIDALGAVRHIVAPSQFHHLFALAWAQAYPQAQCYAAPGLGQKIPALAHWTVLDEHHTPWPNDLQQLLLQGMPRLHESVWLHRASASLIVTDSAQWITCTSDWRARLFAGWMGVRQGLAVSRFFKLGIADKAALQRSFDAVLAWDFDRLITAHDVVIDRNAKAALRQAWQLRR